MFLYTVRAEKPEVQRKSPELATQGCGFPLPGNGRENGTQLQKCITYKTNNVGRSIP